MAGRGKGAVGGNMSVRTGKVLFAVFIGLLAGSWFLGRRPSPSAASPIAWETSLAQAQAKAAAEGKLVMVDFYTEWCRWCQKLDAETFANEKVTKAIAEGFVSVRLNAEKEGADQAQQLGVEGYPTVVFLNAEGKELGRIPGYLGPEDFLAELRHLRQELS